MDVNNIALAGLLHDIGKFWQRTERAPQLTDEQKDLYCPYRKKGAYHSHVHAAYTGHWIGEVINDEELARLAGRHHDPQTEAEEIIQAADWLSAGERFKKEDIDRASSDESRLRSVFTTLAGFDGEQAFFPLTEAWDFDGSFLASDQKRIDDETGSHYQQLWDAFSEEVNRFEGLQNKIQHWIYLLRKYTSRIPSATPTKLSGAVPDISLFDHSHTVSALSACLARNVENGQLNNPESVRTFSSEKQLFSIIAGDLTGIQDFIYSVQSSGAARSLKGRSMFVRWLEDWIVRYLLNSLELPRTCHLISAGGQFQILAPKQSSEWIEEQQLQLHNRLRDGLISIKSPGGEPTREIVDIPTEFDIGVVLGEVSLAPDDFHYQHFGDTLESLQNTLRDEKQQRFNTLVDEKGTNAIFGPLDEPGDNEECPTCSREITGHEQSVIEEWTTRYDDPDLTQTEGECLLCYSMRRLGNNLRQSIGLVSQSSFDQLQIPEPVSKNSSIDEDSEIALLDMTVDVLPRDWTNSASVSLLPQTQVTPARDDGRVLPLEDVAKQGSGTDKVGFVMSDVDSMGQVLDDGFTLERDGESVPANSISRFATLSRTLEDFFTGYVGGFLRDHSGTEDSHYLIYSGGDDLFYLGQWDEVTRSAADIRQKFRQFTSDSLSFSTGVYWTDSNFPLLDGARQAMNRERESKARRSEKNCLTIQDITIPWEDYSYYQKLRTRIVDALNPPGDNKPASRSLLQKIRNVITQSLQPESGVREQWRWRLLYLLRNTGEGEVREAINEVTELLAQENRNGTEPFDENKFKNALLSIRWAELFTQ